MAKLSLSARDKKRLIRICVALAAFAAVFVADRILPLESVFGGRAGWLLPFALYLAVYLFIGYDVLWRAARNIAHGQVLDENFLMCVATLGAFALAVARGARGLPAEGFEEACAVLLFYQAGEFFQGYATGKSRKSIAELMDIRPDSANVKRGGEEVKVHPSEVEPGEIIVVNPGEKIPLDGTVIRGATALDARALTGESLPREVAEGDAATGGCVNLSSRIEIRAERRYEESTVAKILDLVENAADRKSKAENFIAKFARYYTPAVVALALLIALVPGLITSDWSAWIYRALSFLVVSCPCALVISVPLSFFAGMGAASRCGILVKGSDFLEKLEKANVFVFDKTGTLTKGNFAVKKVVPEQNREEILRLAALCEQGSSHPIARSIAAAYGDLPADEETRTLIAGRGVERRTDSDFILCGNEKLMAERGVPFVPLEEAGTAVYVARNGAFVGAVLIADEIKPEAREVIDELRRADCKTVMLTGDNDAIARDVSEKLGLSDCRASLLPADKAGEVSRLIAETSPRGGVCFAGDGINDAPVLMLSDVGIAMGGVGSDAAIEAADVVLMTDDLRGILRARKIAKKTMRVVKQNIVFSLAVKAAVLLLAALGIANMWLAVFGDVGVAVLAILNAMRVNKKSAKKTASA